MSVLRLAAMTFDDVQRLDPGRTVAVLPVGATEAHGPHLPLATDVVIAEAMAEAGAEQLAANGLTVLLLPPIAYTVASYAESFAGTISIRPETARALYVDIGRALMAHGLTWLCLANAHLEPTHIKSLYDAQQELVATGLRVVFPDVTRKPWALRLTDEFKSGACHAGQYEGSIVLAARPDWVKNEVREGLPDNPASLSVAIREGKRRFEDAGGPRAYFGFPARATAAEGFDTIRTLGGILADAVRDARGGAEGVAGGSKPR